MPSQRSAIHAGRLTSAPSWGRWRPSGVGVAERARPLVESRTTPTEPLATFELELDRPVVNIGEHDQVAHTRPRPRSTTAQSRQFDFHRPSAQVGRPHLVCGLRARIEMICERV